MYFCEIKDVYWVKTGRDGAAVVGHTVYTITAKHDIAWAFDGILRLRSTGKVRYNNIRVVHGIISCKSIHISKYYPCRRRRVVLRMCYFHRRRSDRAVLFRNSFGSTPTYYYYYHTHCRAQTTLCRRHVRGTPKLCENITSDYCNNNNIQRVRILYRRSSWRVLCYKRARKLRLEILYNIEYGGRRGYTPANVGVHVRV